MKRICESDQFTPSHAAVETAAPVDNLQQARGINRPTAGGCAPLLADKLIDHGELKLGWWAIVVKAFAGWRERRQTVKILRGLSDTQLRDIGLSSQDIDKLFAERDYSRKVWPNWPK